MTDPLVPADLDLRDFHTMPLDVVRLRDSDLSVTATGDEFRAAILLWCAAWHQVPASSLPDDDRLLARFAGYGRDLRGWKAVREAALHGFIRCSDGRLYHPVIGDMALNADQKRKGNSRRTAAATKAAAAARRSSRDRNDIRDDVRNGPDEADVTGPKRREVKGSEEKQTLPAGESGARAGFAGKAQLVPIDWQPNQINIQAARDAGLSDIEIEAQAARFRKYNRARGRKFADFDEAWAAWVLLANPAEKPAESEPPPPPPDWENLAAFWARTGRWQRGAGPEPGLGGCRCPPEILEKHGIDPANGTVKRKGAA